MSKKVLELDKIDFEKTIEKITRFILRIVKKAKANGVVIGLSGGVDSSVVAKLCVRGLGKDRVLGIIMPTEFTPKRDIDDALNIARSLRIQTKIVNIKSISGAFFKALRIDEDNLKQRIPMANIRARIRMIVLYYYANLKNYLVVGTSDRSEILMGYFTKYGDGGADFLPIAHLYKTQVRKLAEYLGIASRIAHKPSSPQLYPGHKVTDELPIDYEELDPVLVGLFDRKLSKSQVSLLTGVGIEVVDEILLRFENTKHKRDYPPTIKRSS
ncbi:MAG: NAD+ synthase [Candidatus Bathyarchaeia archaeon]